MQTEEEVFAINASNSNHYISNRWVTYLASDHYEVYLETNNNNKISKVHAASFAARVDAIDFILKMDKLCTNGKPFKIDAYLPKHQIFGRACKA